jgi:hypothetical protein
MLCKLTHADLLAQCPELKPLLLDRIEGHWWWTDYRDDKDKSYVGRGAKRRFVIDVIFDAIGEPIPVGFRPVAFCGGRKCENPSHMEFELIPPRRLGRRPRRIFINGLPQLRTTERLKYTYEEFIAKVQGEGHDIVVDIEPWLRDMTPQQRWEALRAEGVRWFRWPLGR